MLSLKDEFILGAAWILLCHLPDVSAAAPFKMSSIDGVCDKDEGMNTSQMGSKVQWVSTTFFFSCPAAASTIDDHLHFTVVGFSTQEFGLT